MLYKSLLRLVASLWLCAVCGAQEPGSGTQVERPRLIPQNSGTTSGLIAVWAVNENVVWACGRNGTYTVTTDGGRTWNAHVVPGAETLQFRDVQAFSDKIAYLLSIGNNPTDFRIYKTEDGGATWRIQFVNQNPQAFYDAFAFWTETRGIAHSDSVNGGFPDRRTLDGMTWHSIRNNMPPALPGEASFASSGTCVTTEGENNAWIATGGSAIARVLATTDGGNTWNAYDTPLLSRPTAGAFTIAFRDALHGIVGGGDLDPNYPDNARTAVSQDGGKTWTITNRPPVTGAIYGLSYVRRNNDYKDWRLKDTVVITADNGGAAWTPDEGKTWYPLRNVIGYWGVAFANPQAGWLVNGTTGSILKISF
ncbi:MAG: hypothetical protein JO354_01610 [Verrucomicrobia bacterium]|nr:hypothetical protein [Verrucomicrobiota bacterium]